MPAEPLSLRPSVSTKSRTGLRFREGGEDPAPHESGLAQGVSSARSSMDETPETFQHPPSGDTGKPQGHSQQAPGFSGESQSGAGFDLNHEVVIYCKNFTMRRLTGAGSSLRTLQVRWCVLLSLMVVRFQMFKLGINNFWNIICLLLRQSIIII